VAAAEEALARWRASWPDPLESVQAMLARLPNTGLMAFPGDAVAASQAARAYADLEALGGRDKHDQMRHGG
jgi:hypothetical protein